MWPTPSLVGLALLAVGLVAVAGIVRPQRAVLFALCALIPVTVVLEAPVLGNHWLLAGFVSVAYLVAGGDWERFEPIARTILVVFYAFAAFAKLNSGFLDPHTSCGVYYANQWLDGFGLGSIPPASALGWATAWGSALVEWAIPLLLLIRRTRHLGVMLALAFHGLISLDLNQHFYDFTAVLLALFVLFLPDAYFERFESLGEAIRPRLRRLLAAVMVAWGVAITLASTLPAVVLTVWFLESASFLWWIPYLAAVVWAAAGVRRPMPELGRVPAVGWLVVALVFLNGLTPYLELKTAYGWNMYSNLVTVAGESNHLLVRSTLPLREGHQSMIRVIESSDPALAIYAEEGYLLPLPSFLAYVAERPDISVTFEREGIVYPVARVGDSVFAEDGPWWWRWLPLRAVHAQQPARCQPAFLPAL